MVSTNPAEKTIDQGISVSAADNKKPEPVDGEPQSPDQNDVTPAKPDEDIYPDNQADKNEFGAIPYKRFKEVIDERNKLREKIESGTGRHDYPAEEDFISDDELQSLWQSNPLQAARATFAQIVSRVNEDNRVKNESLNNTIHKYPELADPQTDLIGQAKSILHEEMPSLREIPSGLAIAAELAAARHYRNLYNNIARKYGESVKGFEATREANLRNKHIEYGAPAVIKNYGGALNSQEQRVASLMGVPLKDYAKQKSTRTKRSS